MSRCFPFPPPGYEKKPRPEDPITVKEEKKEKKHKKEKKDKEKREGKEKKDKERSDGKDREKRDKKEKHKDKKDKEKEDRGKDKEKRSISETNGAASILGTKIEDKLGTMDGKDNNFIPNGAAVFHRQNGEQNIQCNLFSRDMEDSKFVLKLARRINDEEEVTHTQLERLQGAEKKKEDSRFVQELARRIKDEERVTSNLLERLSGAEKKKNDEGERIPVKSPGNFVVDEGKDKDRNISDNGKRIRDDVKFSENQTVQSFAGTGKSSIGGLPRAAEDNEKRTEWKDKTKEKDDRSRNKHKGKDGEKKRHRKDRDKEKEKKKAEKAKKKKEDKNTEPDKSKNVTQSESSGSKNGPDKSSNVSKSCPVGFTEVMGFVPLSDQTKKRRKEMDSNEPVNSSNAGGGYPFSFTGAIGSAPFSEQRNHAIVIRNVKKRKEIEANAPEYVSDATRNISVDFTEVLGSAPLSDDCRNHAIVEGSAKKRKEMDVNGFLYDNEARPIKVRRPSLHQLLENGRKMDALQSQILLTSENHGGAARSLTEDDKEQRKNGLIEVKSVVHILGSNPSVLNDNVTEKSRKTKPPHLENKLILGSNPAVLNDQVIEKTRKTKTPHPDTEFLSQILTVPHMDEWSCVDDLEWLSGSQDPPSKKPKVGSGGVGQDLQVWCDALSIESADIVALPYVLPY